VRISLVVNDANIAFKLEPTELSFVSDNKYPNCVDLALGVVNRTKLVNIIFEGEPDSDNN
jgi:hypothetical protein